MSCSWEEVEVFASFGFLHLLTRHGGQVDFTSAEHVVCKVRRRRSLLSLR